MARSYPRLASARCSLCFPDCAAAAYVLARQGFLPRVGLDLDLGSELVIEPLGMRHKLLALIALTGPEMS
jgi:hypothetical protein